jgi:hypothetical protein
MKICTLALSLLGLCSLASPVQAQNWIKSINEEVAIVDAARFSNGRFALLGNPDLTSNTSVARIELFSGAGIAQGAVELQSASGSYLHARTMSVRADDTLLLSGTHGGSAWLGNVNPYTGQILWETTTVPQPTTAYINSHEEGAGQIVAGGSVTGASGSTDGYLVSYDDQGAVQWERTIGPFTKNSSVSDVMLTGDGGVLAALVTNESLAPDEAHLVRFDGLGNYLWSIELVGVDGYVDLTPLSDGTLLATSNFTAAGVNQALVCKLTDTGTMLSQRAYKNAFPLDVVATADGGAAFLSRANNVPTLMKLDSNGDGLWSRQLVSGFTYYSQAALFANPDGSVMASWSIYESVDPKNYIALFGQNGAASSGCTGTILQLSLMTEATAYTTAPSSLPVNFWFGSVTGLVTSATSASLFSQDLCGNSCVLPPSYCKTSPNSVGGGARISANGSLSVFANDLDLIVTGLPANKKGLFFYGATTAETPFGNGIMCVGGTKRRLPLGTADAFGTMTRALDLAKTPITSGSTWYFQCWYRDLSGGGNGTNLSDGLSTTWCP